MKRPPIDKTYVTKADVQNLLYLLYRYEETLTEEINCTTPAGSTREARARLKECHRDRKAAQRMWETLDKRARQRG